VRVSKIGLQWYKMERLMLATSALAGIASAASALAAIALDAIASAAGA
jgi:hypothetical protein